MVGRHERQVGRPGVPGSPDGALVAFHLWRLDQGPLRTVERALVQGPVQRHALELAVGAIAPGMIGADEQRRVALLVAAHLHPSMAAGVEEDVDRARRVAAQDDGFPAHAGDEIIAGVGDLAFMPDEQPRAREKFLQFLR